MTKSDEVRMALLEKRVNDLEHKNRAEQRRSDHIFYSVIVTVFTTLGYIFSNVIGKLS